ncbi:MFS multidrug transporter [Colletotrichum musicola]|uniref:MFS multidrug transporter n=1 Tax=Colletotrichum musicola TaxID=2175873 RepID=A0A8H6MX12_9PEZI|nr:MFS multidrug transporter [Colletotrichum musicola]
MATLFCCDFIKPYKSQRTDHETKFLDFMAWTKRVVKDSDISSESSTSDKVPSYTIQLVRQMNYGPLESRRYFARFDHISDSFVEVSENFLIQANFQKVNSLECSFKNFKCDQHNRFFELNLYQKDPVNKHHWRANLARPASSIDV